MKDLYTISTTGKISCLGGINGPITDPVYLDKNKVITLINAGHKVYKHNPNKPREKVLVTLDNINSIFFRKAQTVSEKIIQKSIRKEEKAFITPVHTKNTKITPVTDEDKKENNNFEKEANKKETEKINKPDSFAKS